MGDDGSVASEVVLDVLSRMGVSVSTVGEPEDTPRSILIGQEGVVEVQVLPAQVPRRLVQRLAHKFGIPSYLFWHPEMLPPPGMTESDDEN